jgi:hypothetical protein
MEIMDFINNLITEWSYVIPEWLFWTILAVVGVLVVAMYFFSKRVRKVTDKYDIPFDRVDGIVKMLAMLAVRLYVVRKGVEETDKITRIKNVAFMVDTLYPTESSVRLSQLVTEIELAAGRKYTGNELLKHNQIVVDIQSNILKEVIKVGDKVADNENDPLVNPRDIGKWIQKGIEAVDVIKK